VPESVSLPTVNFEVTTMEQ